MNNAHVVTNKVKDNENDLARIIELKKACQFNTYEAVPNNDQLININNQMGQTRMERQRHDWW